MILGFPGFGVVAMPTDAGMQARQKGMPGVRRTLDSIVGPPIVLKTTAPRLANSCHLPKVKALTPKKLPAGDLQHS